MKKYIPFLRKINIIARKELNTYFTSPMAYIVLIVTISVFNIFFFVVIDQGREATLRDMFTLMEFMLVFIIPILTMKVFAEEKRAGTLEFLMTCPVDNTTIVLGKYIGNLVFFLFLIGLTSVYYIILAFFSDIDGGATAVGYCGIILEGALFIAIGILLSSWTHNQLIAALCSYAVLFTLYFSVVFIAYVPQKLQLFVRHASIWKHSENFSAGILSTTDIVYFVSLTAFCLLLTRISIENKLWK